MNIQDIRKANEANGYHFFEAGALRFFRSRIGSRVFSGPGGVFFITSEQFVASDGWAADRAYTVRQALPSGAIETVGKHQAYRSRSCANRAASRLAAGEATK